MMMMNQPPWNQRNKVVRRNASATKRVFLQLRRLKMGIAVRMRWRWLMKDTVMAMKVMRCVWREYWSWLAELMWQVDLLEQHHADIPDIRQMKRDIKDLLTIFMDKVTVKFIKSDWTSEELSGHWCLVCKWVHFESSHHSVETDTYNMTELMRSW